MAGLNRTERRAKDLFLESRDPDDAREWGDLTLEEKAPWVSRATTDMENPPVESVAPVDHSKAPPPPVPAPVIITDPLAAYRQAQGSVKIECPAVGRYVITGFRASAVFIKDVGTLAPPSQIDLPLNEDTAPAVQAALDDYNARKGVTRD